MTETKTQKLDQYEEPIPTDLVLMPPTDLDDDDLALVFEADWYENQNKVLMVSASAINNISDDDPIDADVDVNTDTISRITHNLYRFSSEDGFYHA